MSEFGTVLVMFVINEETSDIIGVAVVSGIEIPPLYAHVKSLSEDENIPERKNCTLTLFTQKETSVMKEIEARLETHDQEITDFHKRNRKLFEKTRKTSVAKWLTQL